ncbi:unnamed protein product [Caenorhabditis angaria]|uniref:Uncharacterized protein n=1 Tax=Caenorhabditis angaria TaxID=860376 RepID=A0A9P1N8B6_9PELO|nr:unnamed protein product [Caenorhabditis angaria]
MSRFAGKVAIITGSSSGIGRATAVLLGKEGAKVTITGRNQKRLEDTAQTLKKSGVDVNLVAGDITKTACQETLVESSLKKFGKINILVNNVGAAFNDPDLTKTGIDTGVDILRKTLDINVISMVETIQKCKPHLIKTQGEIINVSTIASQQSSFIHYTYYGMAKSAVDQLTRCTSLELIKHGVRMNSVSPGFVDTPFLNAVGLPENAAKKVAEYYANNRDCIPSGVAGKSEDIAKCIAFLADRNSSSYIVGQTIVIDGGTSLVVAMSTHSLPKILDS